MAKTEDSIKYRIRKRSWQAIKLVGDIERLAEVIYDCASETDKQIVSLIRHDLNLVEQNFDLLRSKNKI